MQLAAAEEARVGEGRERAEVARTIGELQAQVARDQQEMGFYRGWWRSRGSRPRMPCACSSFGS